MEDPIVEQLAKLTDEMIPLFEIWEEKYGVQNLVRGLAVMISELADSQPIPEAAIQQFITSLKAIHSGAKL